MEKISENGYITVKTRFNLSNYYKNYIQTINEIYLNKYKYLYYLRRDKKIIHTINEY